MQIRAIDGKKELSNELPTTYSRYRGRTVRTLIASFRQTSFLFSSAISDFFTSNFSISDFSATVNFWTPRIALIAYVMGGWLLPALHHHDHSHRGSHDHGVACHWPQITDEVIAEPTDCGCGCDEEATGKPARIAGSDHRMVGGQTPSDCVGLCSLCVATTLLATSCQTDALSVGLVCDVFLATGGRLAWPWQPLPGGLSSRGPPAAV